MEWLHFFFFKLTGCKTSGRHPTAKLFHIKTRTYLSIHFVIDDESEASQPVAVSHGLGCRYDVFPHRLGRSQQALPFTGAQLLVESLGNHTPSGIKLMG
jgi:hypothetical protein